MALFSSKKQFSLNQDESSWQPLADLMTSLMIVFLFISVLAIADMRASQATQEEILETYRATKTSIYDDLVDSFGKKEDLWGIEITPDLSIRFANPDLLFPFNSTEITSQFQAILDEFIPTYLAIVNKPEYHDAISEVRVEGHTSQEITGFDQDNYMYNIELAQGRSNAVLSYILASPSFRSLPAVDQQRIKFWITANGLGYNRTVDSDNQLTFYSDKEQDRQKSRRVEFKIVTNSGTLLDRLAQ